MHEAAENGILAIMCTRIEFSQFFCIRLYRGHRRSGRTEFVVQQTVTARVSGR